MNASEYIRVQVAGVRQQADGVLEGITDGQLNWVPPGTANPISTTLLHTFYSGDRFINTVLQGGTPVWETQAWAQRVGIEAPPTRGSSVWDDLKGTTVPAAALLAYGQAVWAATDAYLTNLTDAALDRKVTFAGAERTVAEVLSIMIRHAALHTGEIAALKGVQGAKGLPG